MSHWANYDCEVKDLDALASALRELKLPPLAVGKDGAQVNANGYEGSTVACDAAIRTKGVMGKGAGKDALEYSMLADIALHRQPGGAYKVQADDTDHGNGRVNTILQMYSVHVLEKQLRKQNLSWSRQWNSKTGAVNLVATGVNL